MWMESTAPWRTPRFLGREDHLLSIDLEEKLHTVISQLSNLLRHLQSVSIGEWNKEDTFNDAQDRCF